jgi:hypothetical protein
VAPNREFTELSVEYAFVLDAYLIGKRTAISIRSQNILYLLLFELVRANCRTDSCWPWAREYVRVTMGVSI